MGIASGDQPLKSPLRVTRVAAHGQGGRRKVTFTGETAAHLEVSETTVILSCDLARPGWATGGPVTGIGRWAGAAFAGTLLTSTSQDSMDFDALTAPGFCSLAPAEAAAEFAEGPDGTCFGDFLRFFFAIILPFYVSLVLELAMMRISTRLSRAACSGALRALAIKGLHGENLILPRPGGSAIPLAVGQHEADWRFLEAISNIKQLGLGLVTDSVHGGRPLVDGDRQAARAQKDLHQFADE